MKNEWDEVKTCSLVTFSGIQFLRPQCQQPMVSGPIFHPDWMYSEDEYCQKVEMKKGSATGLSRMHKKLKSHSVK